jgi:hypothetical protein
MRCYRNLSLPGKMKCFIYQPLDNLETSVRPDSKAFYVEPARKLFCSHQIIIFHQLIPRDFPCLAHGKSENNGHKTKKCSVSSVVIT